MTIASISEPAAFKGGGTASKSTSQRGTGFWDNIMVQIGESNIPIFVLLLAFVGAWHMLGIPPVIKWRWFKRTRPTNQSQD